MSSWPEKRPGELYARLCKRLGKTSGQASEKNQHNRKEREKNIRILKADIYDLKRQLGHAGIAEKPAAEKSLAAKEKELARLIKIHEQRDFKRAMQLTGMNLRVEEVVRLGSVLAVISFFLALVSIAFLVSLLGLSFTMLVLLAVMLLLALPLGVFMFTINYPERLAKNLELEATGSAPEVINYMVMSMELSPSLDRALQFTAENAGEPVASELRALVWKVQSRALATTEDALVEYAKDLERLNEDLRSALYNVLSAAKESNRDGMRASLRRATDLVLTGTRQRVESFAASLGTPATVLFALGILLPMIIGSMLPMMSIGGFGMSLSGSQNAGQQSWHGSFLLSFLIMDVFFPVIALLYARSILWKRPSIHSVSVSAERASTRKRALGSALILACFCALAYLTFSFVSFWEMEAAIATLLVILGLGLSIGYYLLGSREGAGHSKKDLEKLEDQMPDMMFQLGARLVEGLALEAALEEVAVSMEGSEIGRFLSESIGKMKLSGQSLNDVLLSKNGLLEKYKSRKLAATMKLILDSAEKDQQTAGDILITMSNHMRDLSKADKEMRLKLRSTVDSMRATALIFAPVIMGVTVGLYSLLGTAFSEMNGTDIMPVPIFTAIIGIYLIFTIITIIYFCSGIENGRSKADASRQIGAALPLATLIFFATSLGALMAFG
jgi:Flp pilus assembly protein TadB